jgi:hypothetical protein
MKRQAKPHLHRDLNRHLIRPLKAGGTLLLALCMLAACKDRHEPVKPTVQHQAAAPARF